MDIDPEDQAVIRRFQTLSKQRRAIIYRGILDSLSRDEWREVKARGEAISLHRDILGSLPIELALLIVVQLPLVDVVRLRRVSHHWRDILSSPRVCRQAVQVTVGSDPWDQESSFNQLQYHGPSDPSTTHRRHPPSMSQTVPLTSQGNHIAHVVPYQDWSFKEIARQRHRLEQGNPFKVTKIPAPRFDNFRFHQTNYDRVTYSCGRIAWLDSMDPSTIFSVELNSGLQESFMTENRDSFLQVCINRPLLAAITIRGYCVVWDIDTGEESSFRLPSLRQHICVVISGTKVAVELGDGLIVHYCTQKRVTTSMLSPGKVAAVAVHPSQDRITLVRLVGLNKQGEEMPRTKATHVHVVTCTLDNVDTQQQQQQQQQQQWRITSSKYSPIPTSIFPNKDSYLRLATEKQKATLPMSTSGCSSSILETNFLNSPNPPQSTHIVVEPDGRIAFHTFAQEGDNVHQAIQIDRGLLYTRLRGGHNQLGGIAIMKPRIRCGNWGLGLYVWYDWYMARLCPVKSMPVLFGDRRYVILVENKQACIWCFEESELRDNYGADLSIWGHGSETESDSGSDSDGLLRL